MEDGRRYPRHKADWPVVFTVEDVRGTGVVYNLSEHGCAIATDVSVPDDGYASLSITLPGNREPVVVELARVRWATRREFGLEFRILNRDGKRRLARFLALDLAA
jgi:hypothetical protein